MRPNNIVVCIYKADDFSINCLQPEISRRTWTRIRLPQACQLALIAGKNAQSVVSSSIVNNDDFWTLTWLVNYRQYCAFNRACTIIGRNNICKLGHDRASALGVKLNLLLASELAWSPKVGRRVVDPSPGAKVNRYYCRPKDFTARTSHFALPEHCVFHCVEDAHESLHIAHIDPTVLAGRQRACQEMDVGFLAADE